jgi:hypothetical protein
MKMSRWKWELEPDEMLDQEEWEEMEEEARLEEEKHRKRLEEDFYLDFYPERQVGYEF